MFSHDTSDTEQIQTAASLSCRLKQGLRRLLKAQETAASLAAQSESGCTFTVSAASCEGEPQQYEVQ